MRRLPLAGDAPPYIVVPPGEARLSIRALAVVEARAAAEPLMAAALAELLRERAVGARSLSLRGDGARAEFCSLPHDVQPDVDLAQSTLQASEHPWLLQSPGLIAVCRPTLSILVTGGALLPDWDPAVRAVRTLFDVVLPEPRPSLAGGLVDILLETMTD